MNYKSMIGLGVAGNFAGHLEQAGEANDFLVVEVQESTEPKAIFPFYIPSQNAGFLSTYPLSSNTINTPTDNSDNLQIEPEVAIIFDIEYHEKMVSALKPVAFAAYNDCSIRKPGAKKICEKKNWGPETKGISDTTIELASIDVGQKLDRFRIACFHQREGQTHDYGVDSPVVGYSYFHQKLVNWIIDKMNNQADFGPMNNIYSLIQQADYPKQAVISIGATRYTEYGTSHFLQTGDKSIVVVYDGLLHSEQQIKQRVINNTLDVEGISALIQNVI
ncbi:DUF5718 family protein [Vibrio sp. SS-MA-C1-2]|uniref:DUF5718 family protein n=1 Tax=Vibrio sp. SS-MA-C1-2 TaxID=2908646 RepID=UPI001F4819EF|nr:DUF5718 family protein [Vibrio sp. SS-MA-C1-2]UJF17294.1 DUF5718 family protein [Vibrio sp. SS-MA-C1-2]